MHSGVWNCVLQKQNGHHITMAATLWPLSFHAGKKQVNNSPRKASLDFSSQKQPLFVSVSVTQAQSEQSSRTSNKEQKKKL